MDKVIRYLFTIIYILLYNLINSKSITIKYEDNNFKNLLQIINDNQTGNELILYFPDDYYDFSSFSFFTFNISVETCISFIGNKNETVFDYKGDSKGLMVFSILNNKHNIIKFENITFENYYANIKSISGHQIIDIISYTVNFNIIFNNCIFRKNNNKIFELQLLTKEVLPENLDNKVLFSNCSFFENNEAILAVDYSINDYFTSSKTFTLKMENCIFNKNRGLFSARNSKLILDNCYFSELEKDSIYQLAALYYSLYNSEDHLIIKNSVFENVHVKSLVPLIKINGIL
eukprot:jgi/Orpsp1_1/1191740/evm.model.d7180000088146.1